MTYKALHGLLFTRHIRSCWVAFLTVYFVKAEALLVTEVLLVHRTIILIYAI
jgi:hypothetical protein